MDRSMLVANDEYYTPEYCIDYILPHIKKLKGRNETFTVWEPACSTREMIVQYLERHGITTVGTCISKGPEYDFLTYTPTFDFDLIFTNPPFTKKKQFIDRCLEHKKAFILILPLRILENTTWYPLLTQNDFTFLIPLQRIDYVKPCGAKSKSPFQSGFLCYGLGLPHKVAFVDGK